MRCAERLFLPRSVGHRRIAAKRIIECVAAKARHGAAGLGNILEVVFHSVFRHWRLNTSKVSSSWPAAVICINSGFLSKELALGCHTIRYTPNPCGGHTHGFQCVVLAGDDTGHIDSRAHEHVGEPEPLHLGKSLSHSVLGAELSQYHALTYTFGCCAAPKVELIIQTDPNGTSSVFLIIQILRLHRS